ncbi:MAG: tyrosine-type recombinase/integrase [Mycobacterium sp.]
MPRGRPALRIGEHGNITRTQISGGVWVARCHFRGIDGLIRRPKKRSPKGVYDRYGAAAEAALIEHLEHLRGRASDVAAQTLVSALLDRHMETLEAVERAPRTLDTYRLRIGNWHDVASGLKVADATPGRLAELLRQVGEAHGETTAKQLRTLLTAALDIAVRDGAIPVNPLLAVARSEPKKIGGKAPGGAAAIDPVDLPAVLAAVTESDACRSKDLTDPILMHLATGLRVSEVLGLLWAEFDENAGTIAVTGRVVRATGKGLLRTATEGSKKGTPTVIVLPAFAVALLLARAAEERPGGMDLIFPSAVGGLRDPNNLAKQWREVRGDLGDALEKSTGHSFRKTLANLVTETTGDPTVAADALGHASTSTTLRHYLTRNKLRPEVADLVQRAVTAEVKSGP